MGFDRAFDGIPYEMDGGGWDFMRIGWDSMGFHEMGDRCWDFMRNG